MATGRVTFDGGCLTFFGRLMAGDSFEQNVRLVRQGLPLEVEELFAKGIFVILFCDFGFVAECVFGVVGFFP